MNRIGMKSGERRAEGGAIGNGRVSNSAERRQPISNLEFCRKASTHSPAKLNTPLSPVSAFRSPVSQRASSLITTLLVLVVLSTIVVAFMQSMSVERNVARSVKNQLQAQLAVDAGIDQATERISSLLTALPYHAVGYTNVGGQVLTMIVGAPTYTNASLTSTNYLLSVSNVSTAPTNLVTTNSVALNSLDSRTGGWIGSPVTATGAITNRDCRAPWIYVLQDPNRPHQPNPGASGFNPYVARFAYWIEDEASKIDVMVLGNNNGPSGAYLKPEIMDEPSGVDIGAAPLADGLPLATNAASTNNAIITLRNSIANLPPINSFLSYVTELGTNAIDKARFYITSAAYGSQLAGTGRKRVNLNAIVTDSLEPRKIASDLDDIIFTISGQRLFSGLGLNNVSDEGLFHGSNNSYAPLPNFGSRFYPGTVTIPHQEIYLKKIAANIRDYIDSDSQPTIIDGPGNILTGPPAGAWWSSWPPQAIGKEAIPYLQETAWTGYEVSWSGTGTVRTGTLEIDHYLEFFNPSTKDFTAPPGSRIAISNMTAWRAGIYPPIEPEDFTLDISGVTFPAGRVTVITTQPSPNDPPGLILDTTTVVRLMPVPATARRFENRLTDEEITGTRGFQNDRLGGGPLPGARSSAISDTESRLIYYSPNGILDAQPGYGYTSGQATPWNFKGENVGNRTRFVYSASLAGNQQSEEGRSGDPRSLSEQLTFLQFNSGNRDNTRFYGNIQGDGNLPGTATFGRARSSFVLPDKTQGTAGAWGDYTGNFDDTVSTAYAIINDRPMTSIGELGHIYDPYRLASSPGIAFSRGGGRTLKLGQPDDTIGNAARFSTNWRNAAWRLADVFGVDGNRNQSEIDPVRRGMINVNSVARDGGIAFRAFLRSFVFLPSPSSDVATAGRLLNSNEVNSLITSISNYISANGPIMERGELSQLGYFSGASTNLARIGGQTVRTVGDRGREEIYRRMAELITTRSASFSIYCVGEAINEAPDGRVRVLARSKRGAVVRFDPSFAPGVGTPASDYDHEIIYELQ
ncbi:MAG: pilus assembly PilX N-terminal domain-containing protein [Terrimicrobiaceae bacterium]|nr:pilus assembly PilX N-terminal domain-containing protein [Terrimicrobiaceae bacterium]